MQKKCFPSLVDRPAASSWTSPLSEVNRFLTECGHLFVRFSRGFSIDRAMEFFFVYGPHRKRGLDANATDGQVEGRGLVPLCPGCGAACLAFSSERCDAVGHSAVPRFMCKLIFATHLLGGALFSQ